MAGFFSPFYVEIVFFLDFFHFFFRRMADKYFQMFLAGPETLKDN